MQYTDILLGHEGRLKVKKGIDKAAEAVKPTLGAVGMEAMIEFPGLDPLEADDGVTILKNLNFKDHYEQLGLQKLRKAAIRTSIEGGDGTATTTVLTQALVEQAFKEIESDSSKIREVKERLANGLKEALAELTKIKHDVSLNDIESIATISSLDPEVASIIADIIRKVGVNGRVTVEKGAKIGYTSEVVPGARFDSGWISEHFINSENETVVLTNPYIFLIDRKVSTNEQIISILNSVGTGNDMLFIADTVDSLALASLAQNAQAGLANIACVRNPYNASRGKDFLYDMAALTGATVISEEKGMRLDTATTNESGRAEKVIVSKEQTTIVGGTPLEGLEARVAMITDSIDSSTDDYAKLMLKDRLAALTGGIGVIRVGTYTDTEFHAKKYKFENAVNATQAALQEGIVAGGGVALDYVARNIKEPMFVNSLSAPILQMANNAGIKDFKLELMPNGEDGIDFKNKKVVNMFSAGIIDPFKVTRLALESATAIAISLVSKEVFVTKSDEKPETGE